MCIIQYIQNDSTRLYLPPWGETSIIYFLHRDMPPIRVSFSGFSVLVNRVRNFTFLCLKQDCHCKSSPFLPLQPPLSPPPPSPLSPWVLTNGTVNNLKKKRIKHEIRSCVWKWWLEDLAVIMCTGGFTKRQNTEAAKALHKNVLVTSCCSILTSMTAAVWKIFR